MTTTREILVKARARMLKNAMKELRRVRQKIRASVRRANALRKKLGLDKAKGEA